MTSPTPQSTEELEELLSRPTPRVLEVLRKTDGDVILLGVGGKMGPTLARMIQRGFAEAGLHRRVIGVSRFRSPGCREKLAAWGIETITADLLDANSLAGLPDAPYVISMTGFKFGTSTAAHLTWATNCLVPVHVCQRYRDSHIVAFSTGNVYGMVPVSSGGSVETDPLQPDGEYPMAAVGRERMFEYLSETHGIPVVLLRLNYATELRYGVLVDLCQEVLAERPIDVRMGYVNVIWQGDANAMTINALAHGSSPLTPMNLAGPDILQTREICSRFAELSGRNVTFVGEESPQAYLNNGTAAYPLLGEPTTTVDEMLHWTCQWLQNDGETLGKPTHFQVRDGVF